MARARIRRAAALFLAGAAVLQPALAQQDDRGYLTAFLEDNLSGAGRQVVITGFAGALSSRATVEKMTIADSAGIWLTLTGLTLDWNRAALLRGQVSVDALTADEIILDRAPIADPAAIPAPEAKGFALPELPVSVEIGALSARHIVLGAALLGQPVEGSLDASASLSGGQGQAELTILRTDDGPDGAIRLAAGYSNQTQELSLDLDANEGAGGLAATLLGLPGAPATALAVKGTGPVTDYRADIRLASDGVDRLSGAVTLQGAADGAQNFAADLRGDLAPLFLPQYAAFFGSDVALSVQGSRAADGRLDLPRFGVRTQALALDGALSVAADGLPEKFALTGTLAQPDGAAVLLPIAGDNPVQVGRADLTVSFDAGAGNGWTAQALIADPDRAGFHADTLRLDASGKIAREADGNSVTADLTFEAQGMALADPALAAALGTAVSGSASVAWKAGATALRLPAVALNGAGFGLTAGLEVQGLSSGFTVTGQAGAQVDDLARLSALAGRPLGGSAKVRLGGSASPLGGAFDMVATLEGTDLSLGQAEADRLLKGLSTIEISALRDAEGLHIRNLGIAATTLTARASGTLASAGNDIGADIAFTDLSVLGGDYRGGIAGTALFKGTPDAGLLTLNVTGQDLGLGQPQADALLRGTSTVTMEAGLDAGGADLRALRIVASTLTAEATGRLATTGSDIAAKLDLADLSALGGGYRGALSATLRALGTAENGTISLSGAGRDLAIGQAEADKLLRGQSTVSAELDLAKGALAIRSARIATPQLTADATGSLANSLRRIDLKARLANLGLILPEFPGPLTLGGTAVQDAAGYTLDLRGTGPGQIDAALSGRVDAGFRQADLRFAGSAQAALANAFVTPRTISGPVRFDLALRGPLAPGSLNGRVTLTGGRVADPVLAFALTDLALTADLGGGQARIDAGSALSSGGRLRVAGTLGLTAPFAADLNATLERAVLRDPQLYQTTANGQISVQGPLAGGARIAGRIALLDTELRIPSTGLGGIGTLPDLQHRNEPADVRATRGRAGQDGAAASGGGGGLRPYPLDLEISAPNRVFVRGRGLDAELGGSLRLGGTTANIVPSGAFNLIRGRLDILGKRLNLSEALLQMEGEFVPFVRILASAESDGITSSVRIEGQATDPVVSFTSSPELPQEEVLARLLFGQGLQSLSPLQALQLAGAVATLAGRSGDGIVGNLRKGFGLDDLDLQTDAAGNSSVRAGKYLSKNLYSEVQVDQQGKSQINLNLDVTPSITLRGRVDSTGETGLGVYLEKDY